MDRPVLLISASDSSAAAGMQVDLRVLDDLGLPPRCAVSAVTVQGDEGVVRVAPTATDILVESVETALGDPPGVGAVKVGLLPGRNMAPALSGVLSVLSSSGVPIVVDPVLRATSGSAFASGEAAYSLVEHVLPLAAILTPNREEFEALASIAGPGTKGDADRSRSLLEKGARAILITDGEGPGDECVDRLFTGDREPVFYPHRRIGGQIPRGTGCALSTAVAAFLCRGMDLEKAVRRSIDYVTGRITGSVRVGNQRLLFPGGRP